MWNVYVFACSLQGRFGIEIPYQNNIVFLKIFYFLLFFL